MCKSLIAVNMSLPSPRSNNVLTACQIRNWFWNCFNEAVNKFAGAWPSERPPRHQPRSPAVALLTVPKWGWGTQRLTVWLLRICKLWAGISGPVPISEVPCTLDLFWSVCVWVSAFPFQLCSPPSPHPPPPPENTCDCRATLRVLCLPVWRFVLTIKTDCRKMEAWMRIKPFQPASLSTVKELTNHRSASKISASTFCFSWKMRKVGKVLSTGKG